MKYKYQICLLAVCFIIIGGSFSAKASSLDNEATQTTTQMMTEATTETTTEYTEVEKETSVENTEEQVKEEKTTESTEEIVSTEDTTQISTNDESKDSHKVEEIKEDDITKLLQTVADDDIETGKYYYFQKYLYDCQVVYLEKYISHLELQINACQQVYQMGNTTEAVLESYKAQKVLAEAELTVAKNESAYNALYLNKNELDFSDANMKEIKTIESMDYYIENYPDVDYMKIARYVTDCKNAIAMIRAKDTEMKALETDVKIARLLLDAGEISQLEYSEKEISLEKARFELEGQYVQMNISHWQLMMICK